MNGEFIKNLLSIIIAGMAIISSIVIGIDYVFATKAELLFLGRKERMYNKMVRYLILAIEFIVANLILKRGELVLVEAMFIFVIIVGSIVRWIYEMFKKKSIRIDYIIFRYPAVAFIIYFSAIAINMTEQALLQRLGEESKVIFGVVLVVWSILEAVIICKILFNEYMKEKASYYIELGRNKWYLHRRVDDFFMCAKNEEFKNFDEIKLIPIKYITDNGCILKKTS